MNRIAWTLLLASLAFFGLSLGILVAAMSPTIRDVEVPIGIATICLDVLDKSAPLEIGVFSEAGIRQFPRFWVEKQASWDALGVRCFSGVGYWGIRVACWMPILLAAILTVLSAAWVFRPTALWFTLRTFLLAAFGFNTILGLWALTSRVGVPDVVSDVQERLDTTSQRHELDAASCSFPLVVSYYQTTWDWSQDRTTINTTDPRTREMEEWVMLNQIDFPRRSEARRYAVWLFGKTIVVP